MSEFLGSRISLISKSDIRYSGVLHEINSAESTVSLENVRSFGTEGRKKSPEEEIGPSNEIYEYIVFRGSDVKDLRIEQPPAPSKENQPPKVPDDPAIVGARARPADSNSGNHGPGGPNFAQNHYQPNFYPPPPPGQWGRGGPGPGPGPGFNGMHYPPPPGWFPPGQGFPPGGPGPWNHFAYPPGPQGPQGHQGPRGPGTPGQGARSTPQQDNNNKPAPIGAGVDKQRSVGTPAVELPTEPKSFAQTISQPPPKQAAPTPPIESKPTAAEVKATAESLSTINDATTRAPDTRAIPTGPKNSRVTPAVPIPVAIPAPPTSKFAPQITAATTSIKTGGEQNGPTSAAALRDATQAAKAAVAVAMAKLDSANNASATTAPSTSTNNAMDNLTKKVNEMRVNASRGRGRGRGGRGGAQTKIEVPEADFDFQTSNAKFSKQDLIKEAIAGSPISETPTGSTLDAKELEDVSLPVAYNKTKSFFDNISSESKERAENGGQKPGGREWRGEEQRKNMETFGQGSVDGGYRGGYRGRGRGRGNTRGRVFGARGRGGGYRQQQPTPQ